MSEGKESITKAIKHLDNLKNPSAQSENYSTGQNRNHVLTVITLEVHTLILIGNMNENEKNLSLSVCDDILIVFAPNANTYFKQI